MLLVLFYDEKRKVVVLATEADLSLAGMELFADSKIVIDQAKNIVEVTKTA